MLLVLIFGFRITLGCFGNVFPTNRESICFPDRWTHPQRETEWLDGAKMRVLCAVPLCAAKKAAQLHSWPWFSYCWCAAERRPDPEWLACLWMPHMGLCNVWNCLSSSSAWNVPLKRWYYVIDFLAGPQVKRHFSSVDCKHCVLCLFIWPVWELTCVRVKRPESQNERHLNILRFMFNLKGAQSKILWQSACIVYFSMGHL